MSIVKWSPLKEIEEIRKEMDRLLKSFYHLFVGEELLPQKGLSLLMWIFLKEVER